MGGIVGQIHEEGLGWVALRPVHDNLFCLGGEQVGGVALVQAR